MHWVYYFGRFLTRMLLFLLTRWQVKGRENIPKVGPLLVVANHMNLADPPVLSVSVNRKMMFMAKEELFRSRFSRFFVQNFGAFPVNRRRLTRVALARTEQLLAQGMAVAMFPEGRRSRSARLEAALPGSALVALKNGVPILPVGITGTEKIKGRSWWRHRPKITVTIGSPFRLPQVNGKVTREVLTQLSDDIMEHIAELLPPEYRGKYAHRKVQKHQG